MVSIGEEIQIRYKCGTWYPGTVKIVNKAKAWVDMGENDLVYINLAGLSRNKNVRLKRTREVEEEEGEVPKAKRTKSTYNSAIKAISQNKADIRAHLIDNIEIGPETTACVLDDVNAFTCKELLAAGVRKTGIYAPNIDEDALEGLREYSNITALEDTAFVGDFARSTDKQFDLVYLDYMGMPGSTGQANTPISDLQQFFHLQNFKDGAVLGVTVCARSHESTEIKGENLFRVIQAVHHHAHGGGYLACMLDKRTYTDTDSQTMCFVSFRIISQ